MDNFELLMGTAIVALGVFQGWLSARVWRSNLYERRQKIWQLQLIWLVPVLGAGLVFHMMRADDEAEKRV